jgi:hypothetical protein
MADPLSVETMEDCMRSVLSIPQSPDVNGLRVPAGKVQEFVGRDGHVSFQESNSFHHPKAVSEWQSYIKDLPHQFNKIQLVLSFLYIWIPFGLTISSFCGNWDLPFLYHRHTQPLGQLPSRPDQASPAHLAHLSMDLASNVFTFSCIYLASTVNNIGLMAPSSPPNVNMAALYIDVTSPKLALPDINADCVSKTARLCRADSRATS